MGKEKRGILERLSWKSIFAAIITVLSFYFGIPAYIFDARPNFVANLGSDVVSFMEGAILGAITVLLVLKIYSQTSSDTKEEKIKPEYVSKTVRFENILSPNEERTFFVIEGKGSFERMEIQAKGNPDSRMTLTNDDSICWDRSFEELNKASMYSYLKKYYLPNPVRRHGEFAVELDFAFDFLKKLRFSVKNHDKDSNLDVKGTIFYRLVNT